MPARLRWVLTGPNYLAGRRLRVATRLNAGAPDAAPVEALQQAAACFNHVPILTMLLANVNYMRYFYL